MTIKKIHISVVTPVYGDHLELEELYKRLKATLTSITEDFEIIMVNDGSPDNAWDVICKLADNDSRVRGINLSRNFGQHMAITAGLDHVQGEWVIVMDCDLQDQPEEIVKLYSKAQEGYDIVRAQRLKRKDSFFKIFCSRAFHKVFKFISDVDYDPQCANFGIYSRKAIESTSLYTEQFRSFGILIDSIGFKKIAIPVKHAERATGESGYSFAKKVDLATAIIVNYSNKPLRLSIKFGFLLSFCSILYAAILFIQYFMDDIAVPGWTSVMVSIYLMGGLMFINMGVLGLYIGKIFNEAKNRPVYIVKEYRNKD